MLTMLLAFLGSSGFGSILGGLMGWLNRKVDLEAKRMDLEHEGRRWAHESAMRQADLEQVKAEAAGRREVAVVEGEASVESARMAAIGAAQAADEIKADLLREAGGWRWLLIVSDAFRRFIRPGATVALLAVHTYIALLFIDRLTGTTWAQMTVDQRHDIGVQLIAWYGSQASTALAYWFVSRGSSK